MEAIIPVNVYMPTLRTEGINWDQIVAQLRLAQDQSEERQRQAQIRIAAYQQQIKAAHHEKVKTRKFQIGDLVLNRVIQSTKEINVGKLGPNWEGPYTVVARGGNGSYTLVDQDRETLRKQWNSFYLKRYYAWFYYIQWKSSQLCIISFPTISEWRQKAYIGSSSW